jgi:ABC-type glycerol-3-phosphate transport system permease component
VSKRSREIAATSLTYLALFVGAGLCLAPFWWMVRTALIRPDQLFREPMVWMPHPAQWSNFAEALRLLPFARYLANTLIVTVAATSGTLLSSSLAGYAFARLRLPGKGFLFVATLATMMIPVQVTMVPTFVLMKYLGVVDTLWPLILPQLFGNAFFIFLFRQFFLTIPRDLEDAAKVDGAGALWVYWRVMLPLAKPAVVTCCLFSVVWTWNDFLGPLIYLNSMDKRTLALGLATMSDVWGVNLTSIMAAATVITIPVLLFFWFAQRFFTRGVVMTGLKG